MEKTHITPSKNKDGKINKEKISLLQEIEKELSIHLSPERASYHRNRLSNGTKNIK